MKKKKSVNTYAARKNKEALADLTYLISGIKDGIDSLIRNGTISVDEICTRHPLTKTEAVTILSHNILPPEGMVMYTRPPEKLAISSQLMAGEIAWYELTRKELGFQHIPDIQLELWMSPFMPFCQGKRRVGKVSETGVKFCYFTPNASS